VSLINFSNLLKSKVWSVSNAFKQGFKQQGPFHLIAQHLIRSYSLSVNQVFCIALTLFQHQVINVSFVLRCPGIGFFHPQMTWVLEQIDMERCHVLVVIWRSFQSIKNHVPQNRSPKTWTLKPTTHWNMSNFDGQPNTCLDAWAIQAPKTCNITKAMFQPHVLIFHVPPCNPHPWYFRPFSTFPLFV
jgi:hypothetical protein